MRVLFWYMDEFGWTPTIKTLADAPDGESGFVEKAIVAFIHTELDDEKNQPKQVTRLIKQLKWLAKKWETNRVVLHSFAHLGDVKSSPEFADELINAAKERLESVNYEVITTPFGYFLDLKLSAPGHPLARIFKDFK